MFYLTTYSAHLFLWLYGVGLMVRVRVRVIAREKTHCCHYMDYSFRLAARLLLHAPSQGQVFVTPVVEYWLK